jgi:phosphoadenosine phosphosulfate reductase
MTGVKMEKEKAEYSVDLLTYASEKYSGKIVMSSSFCAEDQVLTDMILRNDIKVDIFTIDTGRLFPDTYDLIAETVKYYNKEIKVYFPEASEIERMVNGNGVNLFLNSVNSRHLCCRIRKIEPLKRALTGRKAWISGIRSSQSEYRKKLGAEYFDDELQVVKINPLFEWSETDVWNYIEENKVPYNKLYDKGYKSIGCACCTRPLRDGEDVRAGRWWWEKDTKKECGLHFKDGKLKRV